MRVLIATHGYPPTYNGGAERRAERTARGIAALGYDTSVVSVESISAPHPELRWEDRIQDGIRVRRLSFDLVGRQAPFDWSYDNPRTGEALGQLIDEHQPAIVHLFSGYLMSASAVMIDSPQRLATLEERAGARGGGVAGGVTVRFANPYTKLMMKTISTKECSVGGAS